MNNIKGFQILLKWNKLQSINSMYVRTSKGITLSNTSRLFKKQVSSQVVKQLPKIFPFTNKDVFKLSLHFVLKYRFFSRDTSNFIKLVEDTIFEELHINDARNIELECKKSYLKDSKYEYVIATIEKSDFDYDYFNSDSSKTIETLKLEDQGSQKMFTVKEVNNLLLAQALKLSSIQLNEDPETISERSSVNKPLKSKK